MSRSIMDGTDKGAGQSHAMGSQDLSLGAATAPLFIFPGQANPPSTTQTPFLHEPALYMATPDDDSSLRVEVSVGIA